MSDVDELKDKKPKRRQTTVEAINKLQTEIKSALIDDVGRMNQSADAAATSARNSGITFLLFGFYLAVTFSSTTHSQLMRVEPISMPLLNVELPLNLFYWTAPVLFLLIHLNFLISVFFLEEKLKPLANRISGQKGAKAQEKSRDVLSVFPLVQIRIGEFSSRFVYIFLYFLFWSILAIFPVFVLLLCQIYYAPFHDSKMTAFHLIFVLIDILIINEIWINNLEHEKKKPENGEKEASWKNKALVSAHKFIRIFSPGWWRSSDILDVRAVNKVGLWIFRVFAFVVLFVGVFILAVPGSRIAVPIDEFIGPEHGIASWLPRNLAPDNKAFLQPPPPEIVAAYQGRETDALKDFGEGIDLSYRDLRYADLRNADLRKANLQNANLSFAKLGGADLERAQLQGANLKGAELPLARLWKAQLQGANLTDAKMQGVNLFDARLDAVLANGVDLRAANLRQATLDAAYLVNADLTAAELVGAKLRGVDLRHSILIGTDMRGAALMAVDLRSAWTPNVRVDQETAAASRWDIIVNDGQGLDLTSLPSEIREGFLRRFRQELAEPLPDDHRTRKEQVLKRVHCAFANLPFNTTSLWLLEGDCSAQEDENSEVSDLIVETAIFKVTPPNLLPNETTLKMLLQGKKLDECELDKFLKDEVVFQIFGSDLRRQLDARRSLDTSDGKLSSDEQQHPAVPPFSSIFASNSRKGCEVKS